MLESALRRWSIALARRSSVAAFLAILAFFLAVTALTIAVHMLPKDSAAATMAMMFAVVTGSPYPVARIQRQAGRRVVARLLAPERRLFVHAFYQFPQLFPQRARLRQELFVGPHRIQALCL